VCAETRHPARRLVTISVSHYCEKARWALDRAGLEYVEEGHYPNAHYVASYRLARSPLLPILVDAGRVVPDSTAILRHVDALVAPSARLFPAGGSLSEVERLEERFDAELGPAARLWAYFHWFDRTRALVRYAGHGAPRLERALAPLLIPLAMRITRRRFAIDRASAERSLAALRGVFGEVDALLADGRRFLAGDRFSAADLAFAALSAPVLLPPEHGVPLPPLEEAPPAMRDEIARLRATPAGAFGLRLYAEERWRRGGDG
jgi:glutathione S-transferase